MPCNLDRVTAPDLAPTYVARGKLPSLDFTRAAAFYFELAVGDAIGYVVAHPQALTQIKSRGIDIKSLKLYERVELPQSYLPENEPTYVILPRQLWLSSWKNRFHGKIAVKLRKSLYGHPCAGRLWQDYLESRIAKIGATPVKGFPSNFIFDIDAHRMILNVYFDDLTLSGGISSSQDVLGPIQQADQNRRPSWGFGVLVVDGFITKVSVAFASATDTGKHLSKLALGAAPCAQGFPALRLHL